MEKHFLNWKHYTSWNPHLRTILSILTGRVEFSTPLFNYFERLHYCYPPDQNRHSNNKYL